MGKGEPVNSGKALSRTAAVVGAGSVVVIAAAQTKPEDAISNIAGWLKLIGVDQIPAFLDTVHTDAWATGISAMIGLASVVIVLAVHRLQIKMARQSLQDEPGIYLTGEGVENLKVSWAPSPFKRVFEPLGRSSQNKPGNDSSRPKEPLSFAHVVGAMASADLTVVDGRLKYVDRLLAEKSTTDLKKWRKKLDFQRVPLDRLRAASTGDLTHTQATKLELAVRKSDELETTIKSLSRGEGYNNLAHAAGLYRHRANDLRAALQGLIEELNLPPSPEDIAYREEMARQRAKHDAKVKRAFDAAMGGSLAHVVLSQAEDRKAQRDRLVTTIRECREMIASFNGQWAQEARDHLASHACFGEIRKHLSAEFWDAHKEEGQVTRVDGGHVLPPLPIVSLTRELDRIERENGL